MGPFTSTCYGLRLRLRQRLRLRLRLPLRLRSRLRLRLCLCSHASDHRILLEPQRDSRSVNNLLKNPSRKHRKSFEMECQTASSTSTAMEYNLF